MSDIRVWAIAALAAGGLARAASAAVIVDQSHDPANPPFTSAITAPGGVYVDEDKAQTFTVGVTGTLTRIDVRIGRGQNFGAPSGDIGFELRRTAAGVPLGDEPANRLASAIIPGSDAPNTFSQGYTIASVTGLNVPVTAGDVLAIVLQNNGSGFYGWATAGGYAGGGIFTRENNGAWSPYAGLDGAFYTYVDAVPEPESLAAAAGAIAVGLRRRRRL